jgi:hypothetical protein
MPPAHHRTSIFNPIPIPIPTCPGAACRAMPDPYDRPFDHRGNDT